MGKMTHTRFEEGSPMVFRYSRGSYFGGMREYTIQREGDKYAISVFGMNGDFVKESNVISKQSVIEMVAKRLIGLNWFEEYTDYGITDGYTWSIELKLDEYEFLSWGYVITPPDYEDVTVPLEDALCYLIAFGDDYEGRKRLDKLHIWPLEVIKRELATIGVDWDTLGADEVEEEQHQEEAIEQRDKKPSDNIPECEVTCFDEILPGDTVIIKQSTIDEARRQFNREVPEKLVVIYTNSQRPLYEGETSPLWEFAGTAGPESELVTFCRWNIESVIPIEVIPRGTEGESSDE